MPGSREFTVNRETACEIYNIATGVFYPLTGFMDSGDYRNVVDNMHLRNGEPWTIPITLDIPEDRVEDFTKKNKISLRDVSGEILAELLPSDIYKIDFERDLKKIFGTDEMAHPGVIKEASRSPYRVGGKINILKRESSIFPEHSSTPDQMKQAFKANGWRTVTGFQTRNPIHRGHEYLQNIAMKITDGLFVQPLIGWKKEGDFSPLAVMNSYEMMLKRFYPKGRVALGALTTPMRYAGPREAVFHAIIRRNFGCTHFIVGRDHAGVGNYYGTYDAHRMCDRFNDLGIEILKLLGPYYCLKCEDVVTEESCPHGKEHALNISGTYIRSQLFAGKSPAFEYMRGEISSMLLDLGRNDQLFLRERI